MASPERAIERSAASRNIDRLSPTNLSNVASGTAATSLSQMLGRVVELSVPLVQSLPLLDAIQESADDDTLSGVSNLVGYPGYVGARRYTQQGAGASTAYTPHAGGDVTVPKTQTAKLAAVAALPGPIRLQLAKAGATAGMTVSGVVP